MANIEFVDMDLDFKSKEDMKKGIRILERFFTYDYIGEKLYTINSLNFKIETSVHKYEDEYNYTTYLNVRDMRLWYKISSDPQLLFTDDENIISEKKISLLKSYRKFLIFKKIFNLLDTFTLSIYDDMNNYHIPFTDIDLKSQQSLS